jgi:hypothetical protein
MLNEAIKGEDPEAFEPEFVVMHRKKKQEMQVEVKDPLFDMDSSLDKLSDVSDRYPIQIFSDKEAAAT